MKHATHYEYLSALGIDIPKTKLAEMAAILQEMPADWRSKPDALHLEKCQYGCGGAGFFRYDVPLGHPLHGKVATCQCTKDKAVETDAQKLAKYREQLTTIERTYTLRNWIGTDAAARKAAERAVQTLRGIKVFIGPYGSGKTGLLGAIVNSVLEKRIEASYWVVNDLLNKLRAAYDPKDLGAFDRALEQLCAVRVLVLDEMSAYKPSQWADNTLRTLIDERYRRWDSLLTVVGGNEMPEHEAIASRFHDTVRSEIIYLKGVDLRPLAKDLTPLPKSETDEDWMLADADALALEHVEAVVY